MDVRLVMTILHGTVIAVMMGTTCLAMCVIRTRAQLGIRQMIPLRHVRI
jgi:hypothetical protein